MYRTPDVITSQTYPVRSAGMQVIEVEPWLADFKRCDPSVRPIWANQWLTRTAANLEKTWPRVYELLDAVRLDETWKQAGDASFEAYVERMLQQPFAVFQRLEQTYHFARIARPELFDGDLTAAQAAQVKERLDGTRKAGDPAGGRPKGKPIHRIGLSTGGNTQARLAARLKRDYPDICARIQAGEFTSMRAAAKAAGIVRDKTPLQQLEHWWAKANPDERDSFLQWVRTL